MVILIIEDNDSMVKEIKRVFESEGHEVLLHDFNTYKDGLKRQDLDVIVSDWRDDSTGDNTGKEVLEDIYKAFVPTIIFSALATSISHEIEEKKKTNPLLELIAKGDEDPVIEKIRGWEQYLQLIHYVKENMNQALLIALSGLKPVIGEESADIKVLSCHLNRRAAGYLSENADIVDKNTPSWMQYDYPAMKNNLLVADILADKKIGEEGIQYYVVLTPSCDMARLKEEESKNKKILVARCEKTQLRGITKTTSSDPEKVAKFYEDAAKRLRTPDIKASHLPSIPNVLPCLTVDFKKLDFIIHHDIALSEQFFLEHPSEYKYYRVASLESPFREQLVWRFMGCNCRPGVPECDYKQWTDEIYK